MSGDERLQGFVARLDRTIAIAQERIQRRLTGREDPAPPGLLEHVVEALSQYRESALNGTLSPSGGVVTLGVLRAIGDWNEPFGSELVKAARDLEDYYLEQMK